MSEGWSEVWAGVWAGLIGASALEQAATALGVLPSAAPEL